MMRPEGVDAELVEKVLETGLPSGGLPPLNEPQVRTILAAVLPDIQAQALREVAEAVPVDLWATFGRADRRVVEGFKEWLHSKAVQRAARLTDTTERTAT